MQRTTYRLTPASLLLVALACSEHTPDTTRGPHGASGTAGAAATAGTLGQANAGTTGSGGTSGQGASAGAGARVSSGGTGGTIAANGGAPGGATGGTTAGSATTGGAGATSGGSATETGGTGTAGSSADGGTSGRASGGTSGSANGTGGSAAGAGASSSNAGAAGASGSVCPELDPANMPRTLALTGSLGTHDPSLILADETFYLFQTGSRLPTKTSKDLLAWQAGSAVFSSNPAWIATKVPGASDLWAPDISYFGGSYHLYYAASTFGKNTSCIGHATRASLSSGSWSDQGSIICSGSGDDWNAIDPDVILDESGTPRLAFGSFWGGIQLITLDRTGARSGTDLRVIAARPHAGGALEGAYIVHVCGYYYLFTSWDHCCDAPYDYNMRVGRAANVTGPYTDRTGTALTDGGGTLVVKGDATWTAPGHNAVIVTKDGAYNVYHALDANHANPTLRIAEIAWDTDGWPVSAGP